MDIELPVAVLLGLRGQDGIHHPVGHRVKPVYLGIKTGKGHVLAVLDDDVLLLQPAVNIVEIQHRVDNARMAHIHGLLLLGDAGPQKYHLDILAQLLLEKLAMGYHGGHHRRQVGHKLRVVDLHQVIGAGAAGGDNIFHLVLCQELGVLCGHKGRSLRGLPHILKAQADEGTPHLPDGLILEKPHIGGGDRDHHALSVSDKSLHDVQIALQGLGGLRADLQAVAAQNALIRHDHRALILNLNGLYLTIAHALIAVLALGRFEINDLYAHTQSLPLISFSKNASVSSGFKEYSSPSTVTQTP